MGTTARSLESPVRDSSPRLDASDSTAQAQSPSRPAPLESPWVGTSAAIVQCAERLRRVAASPRPVLITGPTGAGKEVAVQALHQWSERRDAPLVAVNCSAIPEALLESELFGHKRGSFTGAERTRDGLFTTVGRGTLFFDEIAELPLALQPKLLRALETGRFRPVGANYELDFRGRIVAATHVDLARRVAQHEFRQDLYYRLHVLPVRVPALSERREDIPELVALFLREQGYSLRFTEGALKRLMAFDWPGNVRQLRNVIDRLAVLAEDGPVDEALVRDELACEREILGSCALSSRDDEHSLYAVARRVLDSPIENKLDELERALVAVALELCHGNKTDAARRLGVHRKVIERRVERHSRTATR